MLKCDSIKLSSVVSNYVVHYYLLLDIVADDLIMLSYWNDTFSGSVEACQGYDA